MGNYTKTIEQLIENYRNIKNNGKTIVKLRKNLPNKLRTKTAEQLRDDTGTTIKHYGELQKNY